MKRTVLFWAAALLMGCVAVLPAGAQSKGFKLGQWVEIHNALLRELNRNYVDTLPLDRMHRKGIEAMLEELASVRLPALQSVLFLYVHQIMLCGAC